jgi:hypothetical protein
MSECQRLNFAIERIDFAHRYTLNMLEDIEDGQWFTSVGDGVTHVAWQVGHLAAAQYSLCLARMRGPKDEDEQLIPAGFRELFRKGSVPQGEGTSYPPPAEIREVAAGVHAQALAELPNLPEEQLDIPIENPHPLFNTRFGALVFCPEHECLHAGQIALIRRLLGKPPLR